MPPTRKISIRLTEKYYTKLELLVESGEFTSVSEAVREAVKLLLEKYKEQLESIAQMDTYRLEVVGMKSIVSKAQQYLVQERSSGFSAEI